MLRVIVLCFCLDFLCIGNGFVFSQKVNVIDHAKYLARYNYEYWEDSLSASSLKVEQMDLLIGESISWFAVSNAYSYDSLLFANSGKSNQELGKLIVLDLQKRRPSVGSFCNFMIYKNYPVKSVSTFIGTVSPQSAMRYDQPMRLAWQISQEGQRLICGYRCSKATTTYAGRNYIAWFTLDVPVSDGPYKFQGLPGLIVEIADSNNQHCFTLARFEQCRNNKPIFYNEKDYVAGSPVKYNQAKRAKDAETLQKLMKGEVAGMGEVSTARAIDRFKRRNNFIEKY